MRFKIVRLTAVRNGPKRTIFAINGLGLLQMVSKSVLERCANEDVGSSRGWIVRIHVGWRGERNILYKDEETSP